MFDSHCHLHDERMAPIWEDALRRARAGGVRGMLLAGVDLPGWQRQDLLRGQHPDLAVAFGLHPQVVPLLDDGAVRLQLDALAGILAGEGPLARPHAVGELGLDALGEDHKRSLDRQEAAFRAQLALARAHDLPVVLHILRAHDRALRVLRGDGVPGRGGVVHSYSGPAELVPRYVALGLSLSFAGPIANPEARKTALAARAVPRERLLCETDAPDQTPAPRRPAQNEPAFLPDVIAALARCRGEDPAEVAAYTEDNARRLFCFPA
jgi:TatD DNase family protein